VTAAPASARSGRTRPRRQKIKREWSPNQLAKRDTIIKAASQLMSREGVRACTARSISSASGLSTSALHYYFDDVDEIFDLAFERLMNRFLQRISDAAASEHDPIDALWAAAAAYLQQGSEWTEPSSRRSEVHRRSPMLWFEYQAESIRSGSTEILTRLSAEGGALFRTLVVKAGAKSPEARADTLYSALIGYATRDSLAHHDFRETLKTLADSLDISASAKYCRDPSPADSDLRK
jgi:AcrR family transcriptional regulator